MIMVGCSRRTYPSIHLFVSRSRSVARRRHIQAFARKTRADSKDHGRWTAVHMSKRSHRNSWRLCRARSVAQRARLQAFTFLLVKSTLKITVGCPPCTRACTPGAPACRDERPKSCAWAKRPTDQKKKEEGTLYYRNISGDGIILHYRFKLIQKIDAGRHYSH